MVMSYPPFNDESWEGTDSQPLVWTGSGWYYDGDYGGCSDCVRGVQVKAGQTWHIGYRPSSVTISVTIEDTADIYSNYVIHIYSEGYVSEVFIPYGDITPYVSPGAYDIEIDLSGFTEDVLVVSCWFGLNGTTDDRPFTVTNIQFFPDLSSVSFSNWTSYVGTIETTN
jgi:hypothetical protein